MGVMQEPAHLCRGREREKYEDGISKEKTYPVSQKPNEERISRRRSTEKKLFRETYEDKEEIHKFNKEEVAAKFF